MRDFDSPAGGWNLVDSLGARGDATAGESGSSSSRGRGFGPASPSRDRAKQWNARGDAHYYCGRWGQAEHAFRKALTYVPTKPPTLSAEIRSNLAQILFFRGNFDESDRLSRKMSVAAANLRDSPDQVPEATADWQASAIATALWRAFKHRTFGALTRAASDIHKALRLAVGPNRLELQTETPLHVRAQLASALASHLRYRLMFAEAAGVVDDLLATIEQSRFLGGGEKSPPEAQRVFLILGNHYRAVVGVEQFLFAERPPSNDGWPAAASALRRLVAASKYYLDEGHHHAPESYPHDDGDPRQAFRLYEARILKTDGWLNLLTGKPGAALGLANRVIEISRRRLDWRNEVLGLVLRGACHAQRDRWAYASHSFESAWTAATRIQGSPGSRLYWKGALMASYLASSAAPDSDRSAWLARLGRLAGVNREAIVEDPEARHVAATLYGQVQAGRSLRQLCRRSTAQPDHAPDGARTYVGTVKRVGENDVLAALHRHGLTEPLVVRIPRWAYGGTWTAGMEIICTVSGSSLSDGVVVRKLGPGDLTSLLRASEPAAARAEIEHGLAEFRALVEGTD